MKALTSSFAVLQKIGKSLMLPVSVLPVAGILLGVGAADFEWIPTIISQMMEASGGAIFGNLALIFAIGVALGFSNNDGVAALAATVGYAVLLATLGVMASSLGYETKEVMGIETVDTGVLGGIIIGGIAASLFNKYYRISLPPYLGFFSGKRFVPIVTAFAAMLTGAVLVFIWPPIGQAIAAFSDWAVQQNPVLAFGLYGVIERLLIAFGLHHIWNVPFFFEAGSYTLANGEVVTGEIQRYLQGDPTAGNMAGGYLFKMWGLPAAAIAMWHCAKPENRTMIGGIMVSAALTSFITGITEPIEFAFLFVAPVLYVIHALLAGLAFVITILLEMKHGMTFSHGLIDFGLFFHLSTNGWMFFVLGPIYAVVYYSVFRLAIHALDLKTPGRESKNGTQQVISHQDEDSQGWALIDAFGGAANIQNLDACVTRLRVTVHEPGKVKKETLTGMGASGIVQIGNGIQVIFGTQSENMKTSMELLIQSGGSAPLAAEAPVEVVPTEVAEPSESQVQLAQQLCQLLGKEQIVSAQSCASSRVRLELSSKVQLEEEALAKLGVRDVMEISDQLIHLVFGDEADVLARAISEQLA